MHCPHRRRRAAALLLTYMFVYIVYKTKFSNGKEDRSLFVLSHNNKRGSINYNPKPGQTLPSRGSRSTPPPRALTNLGNILYPQQRRGAVILHMQMHFRRIVFK